MAQKCALIVDDSRTAREVLGQVLSDNSLRVETAGTAEEALEYLSRSRPDVIFMDHLMPGMDGFQAVRAIKNNPATATIPIMMYTSQEGELYVGQARALGAIGVLPKQIKPVEVSAVLRSLHLLGDGGEMPVAANAPHATADAQSAASEARASVDVALQLNARDWSDLHRWLQEMFEHLGQELRADIEASVSRLLRERDPPPLRVPGHSVLTSLLLVALAGIAAVFFWLHLDTQRKWRSAVEQNASLVETLNSRRSLASLGVEATSRQFDAARANLEGRFGDFVQALEWGVNQSAAYPPEQLPLADERLAVLTGLLDRLEAIGFAGTVHVESYLGDFCYALGQGESLALAPDSLPAEQCVRAGLSPEEARGASARQSVAFANFLAAREPSSPVRLAIEPRGLAAPLVPYPVALAGLTAGEWNRVARQNNRVSVRLVPDG
jgi:CheY-like chemotaxis protein